MMDLFAQASVGDAIKSVADPLTNIGGLGLLAYFLTKTLPALVDRIIDASALKDDKMTKVVDTIQNKQDQRNEALVAGIHEQTADLKASFAGGFSTIREALLSTCKGGTRIGPG